MIPTPYGDGLPIPEAPPPENALPPTSPIPYPDPVVVFPWPTGPVIIWYPGPGGGGGVVLQLGGSQIVIELSKFPL